MNRHKQRREPLLFDPQPVRVGEVGEGEIGAVEKTEAVVVVLEVKAAAASRRLLVDEAERTGVGATPMINYRSLDWVLNGASHDNFFEKRVTEYSVNGMEGDWGWDEVAA